MGGLLEGRCQEVGGEKLEECCKEQGQLAEASKEGLGSQWAVVPMIMVMKSGVKDIQSYSMFGKGDKQVKLSLYRHREAPRAREVSGFQNIQQFGTLRWQHCQP
jgi:hypothetical protein